MSLVLRVYANGWLAGTGLAKSVKDVLGAVVMDAPVSFRRNDKTSQCVDGHVELARGDRTHPHVHPDTAVSLGNGSHPMGEEPTHVRHSTEG